MGRADYYADGDWNALCYECGKKFKASSLLRHWQGYWVCSRCFEVRQPQDFVRGVPDVQTPPWTQPQPADVFIYFCTPNGRTAIAAFAVAGCAIAGFVDPAFDPNVTEGPV